MARNGMHIQWLQDVSRRHLGVRQQLGLGQRQLVMPATVELRYRYNPDVKSLVAMVPAVIPLLLLLIPAMLATRRTWVGAATFDRAAKKLAVKIIHEAREASDRTDDKQWKRTTVAFTPQFMFTLSGPAGSDGKPSRRVLVGRGQGENLKVWDHPLVIDPDKPAVDVLAERVWAWPTQAQCATDGKAVYFVEPMLTEENRRHIVKIGFPGKAKEILAKGLANAETENRVIVHDGLVHVGLHQLEIGTTDKGTSGATNTRTLHHYQWWTVGLDGKNLRQVATRLPLITSLAVSAHYGLTAWIGEGLQPPILHAVEFRHLGRSEPTGASFGVVNPSWLSVGGALGQPS